MGQSGCSVTRGQSAGPSGNDRGEVVGVVFAVEIERGTGLAISAPDLRDRLDAQSSGVQTSDC